MPEFQASIDLATLNGTDGFRINGIDTADRAGFAVSNVGGTGLNVLRGRDGNDTLTGGLGRDTLIGDDGADAFVYFNDASQSGPTVADRDRINDFESGIDEIDLSIMDANRVAAGNQAFRIDNNNSFSTGEIKIEDIGTDLLLSFNIDADAAAEMQIQLRNINSVVAGDFDL